MTSLLRPLLARWYAPLVYLLLALVGHAQALRSLGGTTRCACRDAPETDWFLGWTPYAVLHGHAPWTSAHLAAPEGVNLMWNTLMPLPGLLMTPVTLLAGPLATHTLLAVLGMTLSATAMWWVAGRWVPWGPARFVAGLLYGFSPYLVGQATDHLHLSLVALPPLVLLCLDELLVRQRRRALLAGSLLGLLALAQLLTAEEVLASMFVVCVAGLAVLLAQQWRRLDRGRVRHAAVGLSAAAGVLVVGAAWPLGVQFFGPRRLSGPATGAAPFAADLLGAVVPGPHQLLGLQSIASWGGGPTENGSYLGIPLLLLLAALAWRLRSVAVVRFATVLGAVTLVLSLGERLHVAGTAYGLPLPFAAVAALPVLHDLAAVRFSLYVALFAALVAAVGVDRLHASGALRRRPGLAVVATLAVAVPLLPAWPYAYQDARTPAYFTTATVERVPEGALALTYPVPRFPTSAPMAWQAVAGYRYRSVGGYVITPDAQGHGTFTGGVTLWERTVLHAAVGRPMRLTPRLSSRLAAEIARLRVRAVLVADTRGSAEVVRLVTAVLGRPGEHAGGVTAWYL
ncbi:MAG: hypothetical protein JWN35_1420 [Frankiales bacterium]|nr:hypothetical protein [Frankiales bacterium]